MPPFRLRKRSTRPPSISTQVKRGVPTLAWQSFKSWWVCWKETILRPKRIMPAGCTRVSKEFSCEEISGFSKPMMKRHPTSEARAALVLFINQTEFYLRRHGQTYICVAGHFCPTLLTWFFVSQHKSKSKVKGVGQKCPTHISLCDPHGLQSICFFSSAKTFKASSGVRWLRSRLRRRSTTGCESAVKIVN